jgi:hypothetical protein
MTSRLLFEQESRIKLVVELMFDQKIVMHLRVPLHFQTKGKSVWLPRVVPSLAREKQTLV